MTLEDFFTLTEMKNGLATLARVEELISIMQQQRDCVMSNMSDTARQWSSVASTLVATEDKDCLARFVKLNGLSYLNQWLQDAVKYSNDIAEFAVEELLNSLLGSLEKLPIHREHSVASGIQLTVEQLIGFKSIDIKEKARALSERWKHSTENGVSMNKDGKCEDDNLKPPGDVIIVDGMNSTHPVLDKSTCREGPEESNCGEGSAETGCQSYHSNVAGCTEPPKLDNTDDVPTSTENQVIPATSLNSAGANANLQDMDAVPSASAPSSCQESLSRRDDSSLCSAVEMASSATCCFNAPGDVADDCDASELKDDTAEDTKMEVDAKVGSPSKPGQTESCKVQSSCGLSVSSHAHKPGRSVSCNFDAQEIKPYQSDTAETLPRSVSIDCVVPKYLKNMDLKPDMQNLLSNGSKLRINDDSKTSLDRKEEVVSASEAKGLDNESKLDFSRVDSVALHDSSKPAEKRSAVEMDEGSELGLEYGEIDALEVARQVAIEVEREVVDYREPFCSSSPDDNSREDMGPQCSDDQQDLCTNEEQDGRGLQPGGDLDDASSPKDDNLRIAETDQSPDKCEDVEMSKRITRESSDKSDKNRCIRESSDKSDKNRCVFDLNEDVYVEESDCFINFTSNNSVNVSAPIAVAASKGAPNFPVSPRRFEGENGWKGSAATSAFRPASPWRSPDVEKTFSGQKRKAKLIEIDLNVAESGAEAVDPSSVKRMPASSGIPSQEDSAEVSSRRADRLKLDLNRIGDEDIISPFPPSCWSLSHQNGDRTTSPASSSSSRQPKTRDFDLNDNPTFFDAMGSHNLSRFSSKALGMHASSKPDNPVITIMGSKITERKDYMDEAPLSFMGNGPSAAAAVMASRPMVPHGHIPLPAYGYSGSVMGPPMPFPPPFYGPGNIPYMVDSRGANVVPQILNTPGLSTAPPALPSFLMSVSNTSPGWNGAGTSQSGLDLNSGFMSLETGSRETGNFKNFFAQGHNGLIEDPVRAASQTAAGVLVNRKEADSGWEPYTFGYKQVTSWQ